ncbi:MAG: hypothetical protein ACXU7Z_11255 [Burkholderiaceae bacterium]
MNERLCIDSPQSGNDRLVFIADETKRLMKSKSGLLDLGCIESGSGMVLGHFSVVLGEGNDAVCSMPFENVNRETLGCMGRASMPGLRDIGRVTDLDRRISEIQAMRRTLETLAKACHGDDRPNCPILDDLSFH